MYFHIFFVLILTKTRYVCSEDGRSIKNIRQNLPLEVLQTTIPSKRNMVVATLPLLLLLCKLASVAQGKAKDELMKGLDMTNDTMVENFYENVRELLFFPKHTDLTYVNKIYLDYNKKIDKRFVEDSMKMYGVHVDKVGFNMPKAALKFINNGISTATYRRVGDVFDAKDINNKTSILLVSAGHFKPTWQKPFRLENTVGKPFQLLNNKKVEVPMMWQIDEFMYYDAKDYQVITKTFGMYSVPCSITYVRPDFLSLDSVLNILIAFPDTVKNIRQMMKSQLIQLMLPRMKIKSQIDLDAFLKRDGIKNIFDSNSKGLNRILTDTVNGSNMFVNKIRQKFFMEVDEFGIYRFQGDYDQPTDIIPPNTPELIFDRPFYFTITLDVGPQEKLTPDESYELFSGVYYGPQ